jgi:hypothetical protein
VNRLVLTLAEARRLHDGTLTEIRRPFDKANEVVPTAYRALLGTVGLPADAVHPDGSGKGWIAHWGRCPHTAEETARDYPGEQGIQPPLGQPGETLWIAEPYTREDCGDDGERVIWQADMAAAWHEAPSFLGHPFYLDLDYEPASAWQPAETMPQWASRAKVHLTTVRAERTGDTWEFVYGVEKV